MSEYIVNLSGDWSEKPIEIVRCRDCVGLVETWDGWECERFSGEYHRAEPDGYCAWGERRERESVEVWNQWSADDVTCSEES